MDAQVEKDILIEVYAAIENTFHNSGDEQKEENPAVQELMLEYFIKNMLDDILKDSSPSGINFTTIKSSFSYLFTKTVDAALIQREETALLFGMNVLYDYNDIKMGQCGTSEYFDKYGANPNDEYALGEMYFFSFQDVCAKYQQEIKQSLPLAIKMMGGAFVAMIPHAIRRASKIIGSHK